jgi:hypothetical protein
VVAGAVAQGPNDLAIVVDARRKGVAVHRIVDGGEDTAAIDEGVGAVAGGPDDLTQIVDAGPPTEAPPREGAGFLASMHVLLSASPHSFGFCACGGGRVGVPQFVRRQRGNNALLLGADEIRV